MHLKTSFITLLSLVLFTSFISVTGFNNDIWKILLKVKYHFKDNKYIPKFEAKHKALDRKTVTISGYMYPLDEAKEHQYFMLSYYPIKVCFFCGGAGPESIIEVNTQKPIKFTSKKITLTGQLRLNPDDPDRMFFILLNARQNK
ncbi:hypothetical protein [Microscilla marina]|uniref:Uncharacterized protein n=1 Tax=Microscilla marina ATCC 23134 TaxID=313606 RepID=A1ZTA6_MICM2|nr:hypothetical protein [Microscilla marina]EAY26328.1 hypothetical protein M23134_04606 [Microscilla marina ATCC 23134]